MKIFVVIPFYNEKKHIEKVVQEVSKYKLPIILVDDGSIDGSSTIAKKMKVKNLTYLEHRINLGKGSAMKTGADYAFSKKAEAVIFMDSDGQHDPHDLLKFVDRLKTCKYDLVLGSRNMSYGVPLVRFLGNKFASLIIALLFRTYVSDVICGYRALTKDGYDKIRWESTGYGVETEMVARIGKYRPRFCEIPVQTIYHDKVKGVTPLDAFEVLFNVIKWRLTI